MRYSSNLPKSSLTVLSWVFFTPVNTCSGVTFTSVDLFDLPITSLAILLPKLLFNLFTESCISSAYTLFSSSVSFSTSGSNLNLLRPKIFIASSVLPLVPETNLCFGSTALYA